jgi:hypothetical protein
LEALRSSAAADPVAAFSENPFRELQSVTALAGQHRQRQLIALFATQIRTHHILAVYGHNQSDHYFR